MTSRANVLLYNFTDKARTDKVKFIFVLMGIRIRSIDKKDYLKPVGVLAGMDDIEYEDKEYEGDGFDDEMLVINHFTDSQMNQMLAYFKKEGIRISLKAALTPTNQFWNSLELYEELTREHEEMKKIQKK